MKVYGVELEEFVRITEGISNMSYEGNIKVNPWAREIYRTLDGSPRIQVSLTCKSSHAAGARRSRAYRFNPAKPRRRTTAVCWHGFRDVLLAVFERYPEARIVTGMADYQGLEGFENTYIPTSRVNIGPEADPVTYPELCDCPHPYVTAEDVKYAEERVHDDDWSSDAMCVIH